MNRRRPDPRHRDDVVKLLLDVADEHVADAAAIWARAAPPTREAEVFHLDAHRPPVTVAAAHPSRRRPQQLALSAVAVAATLLLLVVTQAALRPDRTDVAQVSDVAAPATDGRTPDEPAASGPTGPARPTAGGHGTGAEATSRTAEPRPGTSARGTSTEAIGPATSTTSTTRRSGTGWTGRAPSLTDDTLAGVVAEVPAFEDWVVLGAAADGGPVRAQNPQGGPALTVDVPAGSTVEAAPTTSTWRGGTPAPTGTADRWVLGTAGATWTVHLPASDHARTLVIRGGAAQDGFRLMAGSPDAPPSLEQEWRSGPASFAVTLDVPPSTGRVTVMFHALGSGRLAVSAVAVRPA